MSDITMNRIGWKNGINGDSPSGETPLSAENLKQMENNAEDAINEVQDNLESEVESLKGTVLYNNTTGTTGTVTLSESTANYSKFEITYQRGTGTSQPTTFTKWFNAINGKTIILDASWMTADTTNQPAFTLANYTISGQTVTKSQENSVTISSASVVSRSTTNVVAITKVVGYK